VPKKQSSTKGRVATFLKAEEMAGEFFHRPF